LGVVEVLYPTQSDCGYTANDSIVVLLKNFGLNNLNFSSTTASITIQISGAASDTLSFTLNGFILPSGADTAIVVASNYSFFANGNYFIKAFSNLSGDGNMSNNQAPIKEFFSYPNINTFPFVENFESGTNSVYKVETDIDSDVDVAGTYPSSGTYGLHFQGGGYSNWTNPNTVNAAFANTTHVSKAMTCNVDPGTTSFLSLKFDLRQTAYSSSTVSTQSWFRVLLINSNGSYYLKNSNGDSVFQPLTPNSDAFVTHTFELNNYLGQPFQISLEASNRYAYGAGNYSGDNAFVDNFTIWSPTSTDVGVNRLDLGETFGPVSATRNIDFVYENYGNDTIYQIPLGYIYNGTTIYDTALSTLYPSQIDTFSFATPINLIAGTQEVKAFVNVNGDTYNANDTIIAIVKGMQQFSPDYMDDFEGNDEWYGTGNNNQWQLGTPNTSQINAAHSGTEAWATRLNSNYMPSSTEYLYSPYFVIPANADTATLEFYHMMRVISNQAYGQLEYSINGSFWASMGYVGDPNTTNWYNAVINGQHAWSTAHSSYVHSSIILDPSVFNTNQSIQFRFKFVSTSHAVTDEGWAIDDFQLTIPKVAIDASVESIISPSGNILVGSSAAVELELKNRGLDTLYSIPVSFTYGTQVLNDTWTGTLLPDSTVDFQLLGMFQPQQSGVMQLCARTLVVGDLKPNNDEYCTSLTVSAAPKDVALTELISPAGQTTINGNIDVSIRLKNLGTDTLSQIPVAYEVGGNTISENWTGTLYPGDSVQYDFTGTYVSPAGTYEVKAWSALSGDAVLSNDTLTSYIIGSSILDLNGSNFTLGQNEPNPVLDYSRVPFFLPHAGEVHFMLVAADGSVIMSEVSKWKSGKNVMKLHVDDLAPGVYFYQMIFDGQQQSRRLIKQ
jgi:hypothetical protein